MDVLIVLRNEKRQIGDKFIVKLHTNRLVNRVQNLINENKRRDAFELIIKKAQVQDFIRPGQKIARHPDLIFIEDML